MYSHCQQPVTPSRQLIRAVAFLFLCASLVPAGYAEEIKLPEIGDPSGNLFSPAEEQRLGQAFMRHVRAMQPVITDPLLSSYIQSLGSRLVADSKAPAKNFHFFLIDDPLVNAFAGPGGYIGVYSGLVVTTKSESELASVLAHEIAHVTQNHLFRTFDSVQRMSLPMTALAVAAMVLGAAAGNAAAGAAAATTIQAGLVQHQINFTRSNEEEADSVGIGNLAKTGFDPQAMANFFERMGQATRLYQDGRVPEFLRTHPVTTNRIADARGRAERYPYRQHADSLHYHLLRSSLRVKGFARPQDAVTFFESTLKNRRYRNEEGERYGYARALIASKRYAEAGEQADLLLRKRPEEIAYMLLQAQLLEKQQAASKALAVLEDGLELYPGNYPLSIQYAELLLQQGKSQQALDLLEKQLQGQPLDAKLFQLAARAAGASGNTLLGHRYMAEHQYVNGALEPAIRQLQFALDLDGGEYFQSAQMTARLHQWQKELAEMKKQKR